MANISNEKIFPNKAKLVHEVNELLGIQLNDLDILLGNDPTKYFDRPTYYRYFELQNVEPVGAVYLSKPKGKGISIIWLSERVCKSLGSYFVWKYAHECGHRLQDEKWPKYHDWENTLRRLNPQLLNFDIPSEVDAHITAKKAIINMFGEKDLNNCINDEIKVAKDPAFLGFIKTKDPNKNIDLEEAYFLALAKEAYKKYGDIRATVEFLSGLFLDKSQKDIGNRLSAVLELK